MSTTPAPSHPATRHDELRRRYSAAGRFQARMRMRTEEQRTGLVGTGAGAAPGTAASPVRSNDGERSSNA